MIALNNLDKNQNLEAWFYTLYTFAYIVFPVVSINHIRNFENQIKNNKTGISQIRGSYLQKNNNNNKRNITKFVSPSPWVRALTTRLVCPPKPPKLGNCSAIFGFLGRSDVWPPTARPGWVLWTCKALHAGYKFHKLTNEMRLVWGRMKTCE